MSKIDKLISDEALSQLKEVHGELLELSTLTDEGIKLKCLDLATKNGSCANTDTVLYVAKQYYAWIKGE